MPPEPGRQGLLESESPWREMGARRDPAAVGFTVVHNYAHYFWRPYLGSTAFSLWELLLSYCYGDRDTAYPSLSHLARMLSNSDNSRAKVKGRRSRPRSTPPGGPDETSTAEGGRRSQPRDGALARLRLEGLVTIEPTEKGTAARYVFHVCKQLPLLRPEQVETLSPALRHDHSHWLSRHGISDQAYRQAYADHPSGADSTSEPHPAPPADAPDTSTGVFALCKKPKELILPCQWWEETLRQLQLQLTPSSYRTTVDQAHVETYTDGKLTLHCRSPLARDILHSRLRALVLRELSAASRGQVKEVRFV